MPVMNRHFVFLGCWRLAYAALLTSLPSHCLAWGTEGHQIVGKIAAEYLTDTTKSKIAVLLVGDLDATGNPSGRTTLAQVGNWADEFRSTPAGRRTAPWHFDNVPLCGAAEYGKVCLDGNCASAQLERHLKILADKAAPIRVRNEALKWIVHLVGDIHQPLHAADNSDRGGNSVLVRGAPNLHAVWDVAVVQNAATQRLLGQSMTTEQITEWQQGSVTSWMEDSHRMAETVVYAKLPSGWACNVVPQGRIDLGDGYFEAAAAPVASQQLQKAGVRLAQLLNAALN